MPNTRPALLILQPHLGFLSPFLEADFTVWRFWEGPPLEAVAAQGGSAPKRLRRWLEDAVG